MGSRAPRAPGPAPLWLPLLLLHLQLLSVGGRPHHVRSGRGAWLQNTGDLETCQPSLDLYFLLDKSTFVGKSWRSIFRFVADIMNELKNPKMRIAFITFDSQAYVSMDLTSDEEYLQQGLRRLMHERNLVSSSYVNVGLEKANMMMRKSSSQGRKVTRVVYALTAANIPQGADWLAAEEARKARKMGAIIFTIGANDFEQKQLEGIAHSKDHVFGVPDLNSLSSISSQVIEKSCIEIKYLEPTNVCMGESPDIKVHGRGFANALNKKDIICRFKFSRTKFKDKAASSSGDNVITCPGVEPQILGKPIFIEISLNKGITFITNNLKFSGKDCGENPAAKPTEGKAGNTSKVNSQRLIEQTPEKAPEMPQEASPKNLLGKVSEQAPGKPPEKPPTKLFRHLAARALEWLSKYHSGDADSSNERTDQEGTPEGEGGGEEAEPRGLEIPLPPLVESFISTGSSDFPWIPVVAGAAALLFLLLLCCFFYLCCRCKREPDPCRTVCCSPPCPMMITRCCDCPGTGHVRQMEILTLSTATTIPAVTQATRLRS
ncbi:anthrax toxin receptor-like [Dasypus novemcinctus]|uniref:anthrax toxin receptor-like n=1 Tax=Dasypus novemcinctus TaxID=9361 RepID=UPI00265DE5CF|nr:anthrax toxin receptor-like [Dasypus novemcinctus]